MKILNILTAALLLNFFCGGIAAAGDVENRRFQVEDESIVVDSLTGLMWAVQDNGKDVNWWEARKFCEDFTAGGYDDWRLPDIQELATLYAEDGENVNGYHIPQPFRITDCCMWSSYDTMGGALIFNFKTGKRPPGYLGDTYQLRALPVRGTSKIDLHKYNKAQKKK